MPLRDLPPTPRAAFALLLFSAWLALLFAGFALRGAIHLVLAAALALFPWKALSTAAPPPGPEDDDPSDGRNG